jgi:uncharacterized protein YrrD
MRTLLLASEVNGLPVVTITGGDDVAEVKDIIYSPEAGHLLGLTLNKRGFLRGRMKEVLPAESIAAIGPDAVMITDDNCLVSPGQAPEDVGRPAGKRNVIGNDVLTERGARLGAVTDLVLLGGSRGDVVGYRLDKAAGGVGFIPLPAQLAVSGVALVVPDATEDFVRDDLVGLGAAVDEYRARLGMAT